MGKRRAKEAAPPAAPPARACYYPPVARFALACAYVLHAMTADLTQAVALQRVWEHFGLGAPPSNAAAHMHTWYDRLVSTGSVLDAPHPGHPKLTDEAAREAAGILKAGYFITVHRGRAPAEEKHFWFVSIGEALRRSPRLAAIMAAAGVTPDTLLTRIHTADPSLRKSKLHMKLALDAARMSMRQICAKWFLNHIANEPQFLNSVIWIDQVKLWLFGGNSNSVGVWHSAHDAGFDVCIPCCGAVHVPAMHVCLYAAVHATLGLVFFQYVSGTVKDWGRVHWPRLPGAEERADPDYKVRGWPAAYMLVWG